MYWGKGLLLLCCVVLGYADLVTTNVILKEAALISSGRFFYCSRSSDLTHWVRSSLRFLV
jgi:hypothetical protein